MIASSVGLVPIEDIKSGDKVWATNPETGETILKEVVQTFRNEAKELVHDDNSNSSKIRSITVYDKNGLWSTRVDYMHSHNINGIDYCPHMHIAPHFNSLGQKIFPEITIPWD